MELQTVTQKITDPDDWDGSLFGTEMELVKLTSEDFDCTQSVTDLGEGVKLLRLSVNQSVKVRSRPLSLRYVATAFDWSHGGQFAGAPIERESLLIMPPDFDFDASIKDGAFSSSTIFIPPEQLESYYQTLVGEKLEKFDSLRVAPMDSATTSWLAAWPKLLGERNLESCSSAQRASIQRSMLDMALTLVTHAVQASLPDQVDESETDATGARLGKARKLIRAVEDYSNQRKDQSLRMVDLCDATSVSERTLQYAFKTCLGISPMKYLKRHRLHQVRHELKFGRS